MSEQQPTVPSVVNDPLITNAVTKARETILNTIYSRSQFIQKLMDPRRDLHAECGHPKDIGLEMYVQMYDRFGIAARVVDVLPEECFKIVPSIYEDDDPDVETQFESALYDVFEKLSTNGEESFHRDEEGSAFWDYMCRADKMAGIGTYGCILIGVGDGEQDLFKPVKKKSNTPKEETDESTDSVKKAKKAAEAIKNLSQEGFPKYGGSGTGGKPGNEENLGESKEQEQPKWDGLPLLYLRVFHEMNAQVAAKETDKSNPRYGQPTVYNCTFSDPNDSSMTTLGTEESGVPVHWERIIHIPSDFMMSNERVAIPRMKQVFNHLMDVDKLLSGSAEMFWQGALPGWSFETDSSLGGDVEISPEAKAAAKQDINNWMNHLQRALFLSGVNAKSLAPQVVDPTPHVKVQINAICIKLGVPERVFMGSEQGVLAADQDSSNHEGRLRGRRRKYVNARIIAPLINRLIYLGVLPKPKDGFKIVWPDEDGVKPVEQAQIALTITQAIVAYLQGGGENLVGLKEFLTIVLKFDDDKAQAMIDSAVETMDPEEPRVAGDPPGAQQQREMEQQKMEMIAEKTKGDGERSDKTLEMKGKESGDFPPKKKVNNKSEAKRGKLGEPPEGSDDLENYNPNQPRDSRGRWGSGSGGGGGGSVGGAYTDTEGKDITQKPDKVDVLNIVADTRDRWQYKEPMTLNPDPSGGREFVVGGVKFKEAGNCHLESGSVTIHGATDWGTVDDVRHLTAHELMHGTYEKVFTTYRSEMGQLGSDMIKANGDLKPEYADKYPTYNRINTPLTKVLTTTWNTSEVDADNWGVSEYSRAYWRDFKEGKVSHHIAVHETLAEIAGIHEATGVIKGTKEFKDLYKVTRNEYQMITGSKKRKKSKVINTLGQHQIMLDKTLRPVSNVADAEWISVWEGNSKIFARKVI